MYEVLNFGWLLRCIKANIILGNNEWQLSGNKFIVIINNTWNLLYLKVMCLHYKALSHYYVADGLLKSVGKV